MRSRFPWPATGRVWRLPIHNATWGAVSATLLRRYAVTAMDQKTLSSDPPAIAGLHFVRPLGGGGFADVGLYESDFPRRQVAVKALHTSISAPDSRAAFQQEADALARVSSHPSILTIHSAGVSADGRPYLVLEYCPRSVGDTFRSSPLSVPEVLDLGIRVGCALETCHRLGIIHRDIKPSNILITDYGQAVIADFGIVGPRQLHATPQGADTPALSVPWSAPEVVLGRSSGSVASEVWGLCATLYALLAGHGPFERPGPGANAEDKITKRIIQARYRPLPDAGVPVQLQEALAQGMAKRPQDRQSSVLTLVQQLRKVQQHMRLSVTPLQIAGDPERAFWTPEPDSLMGQTSRGTKDARGARGTSKTSATRRTRAHGAQGVIPVRSHVALETSRRRNMRPAPAVKQPATEQPATKQPIEEHRKTRFWSALQMSAVAALAATIPAVAVTLFIVGLVG